MTYRRRGGKRWGLALIAVLVTLVSSGCWPVRGQGPDRTGYNPFESAFTTGTVGGIHRLWTFQPTWEGSRGVVGSAVVSSGGVHLAVDSTVGPRLVTVDPASGDVRWSRLVDGDGSPYNDPAGPPAVDGDRVIMSTLRDNPTNVDSDHGVTELFDVGTGENLGVAGRGGDIQAVHDGYGVLVVQDRSSTPYGVSLTASAGQLVPGARPRPIDLSVLGPSLQDLGGVTIGRGLIFHAGIGATSSEPGDTDQNWGVRAYSVSRPGEVTCGPLGSPPKAVECPLWAVPAYVQPGSAPVVDPARPSVYVAASYSGLLALDGDTGATTWTGTFGDGTPTQTPALANDTLYVGTDTGVAAYAAGGCGQPTCPPVWDTDFTDPAQSEYPGQAQAQPVVAGDVVFVPVITHQTPRLLAFDADGCGEARCDPIWATELPAAITGDLSISAGHLYAPTEVGLVAYGL